MGIQRENEMKARAYCTSIFQAIFYAILLSGVLSCGSGRGIMKDIHLHKNLEVWRSPDLEKIEIKRIAILPFVSPRHEAGKEIPDEILCSFCGHPIVEHKDFSEAGERLAVYLYEEIHQRAAYETVPLEQVIVTLNLEQETRDPYTDIGFLKKIGSQLGVDSVVVGEVLEIKERVGANYSVVTPASVSFRIKMIRVMDGMEYYRASFYETQKPLSEEPQRLFNWSKIRLRWQTAEQLSRAGMRDVAASFPGIQKKAR
jgi:hypothetical protein